MKPKSLNEFIQMYERKTHDKFVFRNDYYIFYLATKGFMTAKIDKEGSMLIVEYACGVGDFWRCYAELLAREHGLKYVGTFCNRNIKAYFKSMNLEILAEKENELGQKRFLAQDEIGRKVVVSFKQDREGTLEPEYYVTLYLNEKATSDFNELDERG